MLDVLNLEVRKWDYKTQIVWWVSIPKLINDLENNYYQTKEVEINIEVFSLRDYGFECVNLFSFLTHYKLVENADLNFPIILNNEWSIIDWRHRLCKAILEWRKTIKWIMILDSKVID